MSIVGAVAIASALGACGAATTPPRATRTPSPLPLATAPPPIFSPSPPGDPNAATETAAYAQMLADDLRGWVPPDWPSQVCNLGFPDQCDSWESSEDTDVAKYFADTPTLTLSPEAAAWDQELHPMLTRWVGLADQLVADQAKEGPRDEVEQQMEQLDASINAVYDQVEGITGG